MGKTNWDTLKKVIEECPRDTSPVGMEEVVNEEVDDDSRRYLIEENEPRVNNED